MKRYIQSVMAAALFSFLAGCSGEATDQVQGEAKPVTEVTFFSGARLITGDGSAPIEAATFIVENGKFKSIGMKNELKPPDGAGRADLTDRTVMPVLINLHGHAGINNGATSGAQNYTRESVLADLNRYIYYGVNVVALMGTDPGDLIY